MRLERCSDDESDPSPRVGYRIPSIRRGVPRSRRPGDFRRAACKFAFGADHRSFIGQDVPVRCPLLVERRRVAAI
jgi:hypothetical protein